MTSGASLDLQISTQDALTQDFGAGVRGGVHIHGLGGDDTIAAVHQKAAHAEVASMDLAAPLAFVPENQNVSCHLVANPHRDYCICSVDATTVGGISARVESESASAAL